MLSIFSCASWASVCLLGEMSVWIVCPFFDWVIFVVVVIEWYELFIFWKLHHLQIFSPSQSIGCLFVLFMVSLTVQKLIRVIRSHLFIFSFISMALGHWPKNWKQWYNLCQRMFCLCSLLGVFLVSCLIFKSLSRFLFVSTHG